MNRSTPRSPRRTANPSRAVLARSTASSGGAAFSPSRSGSSKSDSGWLEQFGRVVLFAVAALGIAHVTALILMSVYRHSYFTQQADLTAGRISALKSEVRELEVRAAKARSDRDYLEQLARRQGFVRKSERVMVPLVPGARLPLEDPAPTVPAVR
jgi:cell division protein FtsB